MGNERIAEQVQNQQQEAFKEIAKKYYRYAYIVIANVLGRAGTKEDVEELVQDTLYSLWSHAYALQSKHLKSYICVTARNKAKNWLRGCQRIPIEPAIIEIPDPEGSLEDAAIRKELAHNLRNAIRRMSPKDREIFLRHFLHLRMFRLLPENWKRHRTTLMGISFMWAASIIH